MYFVTFWISIISVVFPFGILQEWMSNDLAEKERHLQNQAVVVYGVLDSLNWSSVKIFTDHSTELSSYVMAMLTDGGRFRVGFVSRDHRDYFHRLAVKGFLADKIEHLYVIICHLECVQRIIETVTSEASGLSLFTSKWLVVTGSRQPNMIPEELENVAYLYFKWYPYLINEVSSNGTQQFVGIAVDIMETLAKDLNFRIKYVTVAQRHDVWTKFEQMLINKKIDVIACPYLVSPERSRTLDLMYPVEFSKLHAYYRLPRDTEFHWTLFVDSLSWPVIVVTFLALVSTAFALGIFQSVNQTRWGRSFSCTSPERMPHDSWFLFGNLVKQGQSEQGHKTMSTRFVVSAWCVFCLIMTVTFTAHLVPLLGLNRQPVLFRSVTDLLHHGGYKWGVYGGSNWTLNLFKNSKDYQELYQGIKAFNSSDSEVISPLLEVHLQKVLTENYAFFMGLDVMQSYYAKHCEVTYIKETVTEIPHSFPLQKNSVLTKLFSYRIMQLHENGQIDVWTKKWLPKRSCDIEKTKSSSLSLSHTQSVFVLIACGITLSTTLLFFEICTYGYIKRRTLKVK